MTDELKETKTGALQTLDNKKFKLIETLRLKIIVTSFFMFFLVPVCERAELEFSGYQSPASFCGIKQMPY